VVQCSSPLQCIVLLLSGCLSVWGLRPCVATACWTCPDMSKPRVLFLRPQATGEARTLPVPIPIPIPAPSSNPQESFRRLAPGSINHVTWPSGNRVLTEMQMGLGLIKFWKQRATLEWGTENNAQQQIKLSIRFGKFVKILWPPLFNAFTCPECGVRLEVPKDSRSFVYQRNAGLPRN